MISVARVSSGCSNLKAIPSPSYISSSQAMSGLCTQSTGIFDQEFTISANKGQSIQLALIDLSHETSAGNSAVQELGYVLDSKTEKVTAIETKGQRESAIVQTEGHIANVALSSSPPVSFLIAYQGISVPNYQPNPMSLIIPMISHVVPFSHWMCRSHLGLRCVDQERWGCGNSGMS